MAFLKFEDLRVFKAQRRSQISMGRCHRWETFAKLTVGKQLVRSADSLAPT